MTFPLETQAAGNPSGPGPFLAQSFALTCCSNLAIRSYLSRSSGTRFLISRLPIWLMCTSSGPYDTVSHVSRATSCGPPTWPVCMTDSNLRYEDTTHIGITQSTQRGVVIRQRLVLADSFGAVHLHGAVDDS